MNVLVIPGYYSEKDNPVKGVFIREQIQAIKNHHDVRVLFPQTFISAAENFKVEKNDEDGITTYRTYLNILANPAKSALYHLFNGVISYEYILRDGFIPNLIHAHVAYPSGVIALILNRRYNLPYVVTEHSRPSLVMRTLSRKNLVSLAVKHAAYTIPVSNLLRDAMEDAGLKGNYRIIPNVVNHYEFTPKWNKSKKTDRGTVNAIVVANMRSDHIKGLRYLFKALQIIKHDLGDFCLHIVGDGEAKEEYVKLAADLDIIGYCKFYGYLSKPKVAELMRESDFFIMSSDYESGGCVLLEALASGLPVVSTKVGYALDEVNEKTGVLVEPKNSQSLAEGITYMMKNFHRYDPDVICRVSQKYSYANYLVEIDDVYQQVLSGRASYDT